MEDVVINIINLPKRQDRREAIIKQMGHQGCAYRFWDGVTGKVAKTSISQAHKAIIKYAKENNSPVIAVAEDDVCFTGSGAWKYFLSKMPEDFDIYTGSYYSGSHDKDYVVTGFRGMSLYICHSRFYEKFLSLPETMHIDGALAISGAKIVVCDKFVCTQAPGYSDQRKRWADDSYKLKGKELYGQ